MEEDISKEIVKKEGEAMSSIIKPNTRAFTLRADKVDEFKQNKGSLKKAMERFNAHHPKDGVVTPFKRKDV